MVWCFWATAALYLAVITLFGGGSTADYIRLWIVLGAVLSMLWIGAFAAAGRFRSGPWFPTTRTLLSSLVLLATLTIWWGSISGPELDSGALILVIVLCSFIGFAVSGEAVRDAVAHRHFAALIPLVIGLVVMSLPRQHFGFIAARSCLDRVAGDVAAEAGGPDDSRYEVAVLGQEPVAGRCGLVSWSDVKYNNEEGSVLLVDGGGNWFRTHGYLWNPTGEPDFCSLAEYRNRCTSLDDLGGGWYAYNIGPSYN